MCLGLKLSEAGGMQKGPLRGVCGPPGGPVEVSNISEASGAEVIKTSSRSFSVFRTSHKPKIWALENVSSGNY